MTSQDLETLLSEDLSSRSVPDDGFTLGVLSRLPKHKRPEPSRGLAVAAAVVGGISSAPFAVDALRLVRMLVMAAPPLLSVEALTAVAIPLAWILSWYAAVSLASPIVVGAARIAEHDSLSS